MTSDGVGIGTIEPAGLLHVKSGTRVLGGRLLPTMTAQTTSGVTITGSSQQDANRPAWHVADKLSEGSNDDATYTTIDTQSGQSGWTANERRYYTLASQVTYRYYKFTSMTNSTVIVEEFDLLAPDYGGLNALVVSQPYGNVGIGTSNPLDRLQVGVFGDGSVAKANSWASLSDRRLKRDLTEIPDALAKLRKIAGYYYYWEHGADESRQVGVVAQEIETIMPELVRTGADGIKTVDYPKLNALLIEALKELDAENQRLKTQNQDQQAQLSAIKALLCQKFPESAICNPAGPARRPQ